MDYALTDEQAMLRDAAREWLRRSYPDDRLAEIADGVGTDPRAWAEITRMGWADAAAAGSVETAVLLEQAGYGLLPAPLFVTVGLAAALGADASVPTTLAWAEDGARYLGDPVRTTVDGDGRVSGTKVLVPDLAAVTHAVVTTTAGPRLVAVADASVTACASIDGTRRLGELVLDGTPSQPLPAVEPGLARAKMLTAAAAEAVGVAQRVVDLAVEHAKNREQFGRIIGTYQGVSHKIADAHVAVELARSLVTWASWALDAGDPASVLAAHAAKSDAGSAAVRACEVAIQVHGGIGMTWDSILHRYYKRAQWLQAFEGGAPRQRAVVADALLGPVAP
ncbi:MAG TPA: acyl-CoA dehydrogenase family protein [Mycobacteriales bacterium]|jgi:alkylation response protein AidB-like acyl-CoA dehydrogenase|nr:acyl-CoA dehydrogenase family protein [Mycobacteriales bacterium]